MRRLLLAISLISLCFLSSPQPARAYDFFSGVNCSQASSSTVCNEKSKTANPLTGCPANSSSTAGCGTGILDHITNIIAYIAGAAAVILIIVGAIRYVTSGSDVSVGSRIDDDVLNAKRTIANALIGLAIIVLAKTIINYVISKVH